MKADRIDTSIDMITTEAINNSAASLIPEGSILIVVRSGILARTVPIAITSRELAVNQDLKALCPKSNVDKNFLRYFLLSEEKAILNLVTRGATVHRLSTDHLKALNIPIPQLSEQRRIVAILDEVFEGIDTAIANTEANLTSARALFEFYHAGIFGAKSGEWKATNLGSLATFRNGLNFTKNSEGERVKIVGVKDFQNNFFVPFNELDGVNIDGALQEKDELRDGDIFAVRSNGNKELIGRCLLATNVVPKTSHSGFTIRIRLDSEDISPVFLTYFLKSHACRRQLVESGGGTNISSLNQKSLASLPIFYPPRDEQDAIVHDIEAVSGQTHLLESVFKQKLDLLAELKQSILQKAFSGELTSDGKHEDAAA